MHGGAAFEQEFGFFGLAFEQQIEFVADQGFLLLFADLALDGHQVLAAAFDFARGKLLVKGVGLGAVLVGVGEGAHPVELGLAHEVAEFFEFFFGLAGEADDERRAEGQVGNGAAHFCDRAEEDIGSAATLHALQH